MENYNLVKESEYLTSELDIKNYFLNSNEEIEKGIFSVKLVDLNEKTGFFTVLIKYGDIEGKYNEVKRIGSIKRTNSKYIRKDTEDVYMTKKEWNILRRRGLKRFGIGVDEENGKSLSSVEIEDNVKFELRDDDVKDIQGIYYDKNFIIKIPVVKMMPNKLCNDFNSRNDRKYENVKKSSFFRHDDNAFVIPSFAGMSSGFGSGKVFSVRLDNLDESLSLDELKQYVKDMGVKNYKDIRLIMKKRKNNDGSYEVLNENRGFGFIEFFSDINAENAIFLLDKQLIGYQIISATMEVNQLK